MLLRFIAFITGLIFFVGGAMLAKQSYEQDLKNVYEPMLVFSVWACVGFVLCYIAIFGPSLFDW